MSDVLGYVVVEWQANGEPNPEHGMGLTDDLKWALKLARMQREGALGQRGIRFSVHAVMAEEIEDAT